MKTTKEIIYDELGVFEINKNKRWWSETELRETIENLTLDNPASMKKGYIKAELLKRFLFEEHAPNLNSRSSDEGGKTTAENCQMLCKHDNRIKSGK